MASYDEARNICLALVSGGVWEEMLRRYLHGAAAAMDLPAEGATLRAAADASEVVVKWVCTGGPTAMPSAPDAGTVGRCRLTLSDPCWKRLELSAGNYNVTNRLQTLLLNSTRAATAR